jgi:hypothetical protein
LEGKLTVVRDLQLIKALDHIVVTGKLMYARDTGCLSLMAERILAVVIFLEDVDVTIP